MSRYLRRDHLQMFELRKIKNISYLFVQIQFGLIFNDILDTILELFHGNFGDMHTIVDEIFEAFEKMLAHLFHVPGTHLRHGLAEKGDEKLLNLFKRQIDVMEVQFINELLELLFYIFFLQIVLMKGAIPEYNFLLIPKFIAALMRSKILQTPVEAQFHPQPADYFIQLP